MLNRVDTDLPVRTVRDCVFCGYSLQGLPERCRCPECGAAYDEFSAVWFGRRSFFFENFIAIGVLTVPTGYGCLLTASDPIMMMAVLATSGSSVLALLAWWLRCYLRGLHPFVAALPDSIAIKPRTNSLRVKHVGWDKIGLAASKHKSDDERFVHRFLGNAMVLFTKEQAQEMSRAWRARLGSGNGHRVDV